MPPTGNQIVVLTADDLAAFGERCVERGLAFGLEKYAALVERRRAEIASAAPSHPA